VCGCSSYLQFTCVGLVLTQTVLAPTVEEQCRNFDVEAVCRDAGLDAAKFVPTRRFPVPLVSSTILSRCPHTEEDVQVHRA
jgi:hypothetical protein